MADVQVVEGFLVACVESAYKAFTDDQGNERPGGVTYRAYVVDHFGADPKEIRVPDAGDFSDLREAGQFARVKVSCELQAFRNKLSRKLVPKEVEVVSPAPTRTQAKAS